MEYSVDFHLEIGKISIRARLTKLDVGWRLLAVVILLVSGLLATLWSN
jgi:hypothetical protein